MPSHCEQNAVDRILGFNICFSQFVGTAVSRLRTSKGIRGSSKGIPVAKIFYSMAGEGRGHAVRVRTVVEHLRQKHELILFASADAYEFLKSVYENPKVDNVRLNRMDGLRFHYTGGKLDLFKSIAQGFSFSNRVLPELVQFLRRRIEHERPDLAISDFEPGLPRAAIASDLPWMSLDHQHVLLAYDLHTLPFLLRRYAWWMSWAVRWYYGWANDYQAVASSFYTPSLKPSFKNVKQVGPILRPEIVNATTGQGDFLLSYLRPNTPEAALNALSRCGLPVRVYGLGARSACERVTFHAIDQNQFVDDLANCRALFSAAGNQLLGEALYFGKPVFAIPELMHHEQQINAHFLKRMGAGDWTVAEQFHAQHLTDFLTHLPRLQDQLVQMKGTMNGTPDAIAAIESVLAGGSSPQVRAAA